MESPTAEQTRDRDLAEMERWTGWVIRLTAHAADRATDPTTASRLMGARDDAESLRDALAAAASGWLDDRQVTVVRSVYELWDDNHDRTERLAAAVDPDWYVRWQLRSDGARPGRHATVGAPILTAAAV
jgi:hypothetical protein